MQQCNYKRCTHRPQACVSVPKRLKRGTYRHCNKPPTNGVNIVPKLVYLYPSGSKEGVQAMQLAVCKRQTVYTVCPSLCVCTQAVQRGVYRTATNHLQTVCTLYPSLCVCTQAAQKGEPIGSATKHLQQCTQRAQACVSVPKQVKKKILQALRQATYKRCTHCIQVCVCVCVRACGCV